MMLSQDIWHILHPMYLSLLCGDSIKTLLLAVKIRQSSMLLAIIIFLCKRIPEPVGEHVLEFPLSIMLVERDSNGMYF